jgi:putative membrane protein
VTIPHFSDHAANERTFLAWVRTAIAVMAFGFLVERFDIFLKIASKSLGKHITVSGQVTGSLVGLALIISGAAMVLTAMIRFTRIRIAIADETPHDAEGFKLDLVLAGFIVVLGIGLAIYLGITMLHGAKSA